MVTGICDQNKSRARHHSSLKLGWKLECLKILFASSINTSLIFVLNVENGTQFLNAMSVSLFAFTAISPVTEINASE